MVREADAAALVADVMVALHLRGHDVKVTHVNGPRLLRLCALLLAEFSAGTEQNGGRGGLQELRGADPAD